MNNTIELLTEYSLKPNKALGQNFLIDEEAIDRIVSLAAEAGLPVLEIGPGLGALTFPLAGTGVKLAAVELDKALSEILAERLPENASVINRDFLKADLGNIHSLLGGGELTAIGNLPYYVTSDIMMRLITSGLPIRRMVIMTQREAADRFTARPGDRNYVPLSVLSQRYFTVTAAFDLSPASYRPQPEVASRVTVFDRNGIEFDENFPRFLKCAFAMRRKTLANNLAALGVPRAEAAALIEKAGLSPSVRAEALGVDTLAGLCRSALETHAGNQDAR